MKYKIKKISEVNKLTLRQINNLLLQLSSRKYQINLQQLKSVIKNNYIVAVYLGNKIVGTATLVRASQITGDKGYLEDVVVDANYRGKGLGKKLVINIIKKAKRLKLDSLELKSETYRIAANGLYKKLGFTKKEADVYKFDL